MKNLLFVTSLLFLFGCATDTPVIRNIGEGIVYTEGGQEIEIKGYNDNEATIFYIVRHAEKADNTDDAELSATGTARAEKLGRIMQGVPLARATSTNYARTTSTANPAVFAQKPRISVYYPDEMPTHFGDILTDHKGENVLVVGHSNTVPELLNLFTGKTVYTDIPDSDYGRFYIATVYKMGDASIAEFEY